jgi:hypothetical protein
LSLKVFISYAKEDRLSAIKYYDLLKQESVIPWLDEKNIFPGQNWSVEIEKAFNAANVIFLLLSQNSVKKRGFVQREANDAIEKLRYKQPTDVFIIPLLLESCEVPMEIANRLQYIEVNNEDAWQRVKASLKLAAEQQSIEINEGIVIDQFRVFTEKFEEEWDGMPGHDIKIDYPRFESSSRSEVAKELTLLFGGRASKVLYDSRQKPWEQFPDLLKGYEGFVSRNGRWENFKIVHCNSKFLSINYHVGWYGAGAAHSNSGFSTYNFALLDRVYPLSLTDFFSKENEALKIISRLCIEQLCREHWRKFNERPDKEAIEWFEQGAGPALENFVSFTVTDDCFTFLFHPYQVGPYAAGDWSVDVPFYDLFDTLRPGGPHTLANTNSHVE